MKAPAAPLFEPACLLAGWALAAAVAAGPARNAVSSEIRLMDINRDGQVSPQEHEAGVRRMFQSMDTDRDGRVTAAEMNVGRPPARGNEALEPGTQSLSSRDKIRAIDADGDGTLSAAEHVNGAKRMFRTMDVDHDGQLSRAELAAGHRKMLRKPPR